MKHRPFKEVIYNEDGTFTLKLDGVVKDKWVLLPKGDKSKHNRAVRRQAVRLWKQKYNEKRNAKKFKPDGTLNWNVFLVRPDRIIDNRPRPMSLTDMYMERAMKAQAAFIDRLILGQYADTAFGVHPGTASISSVKWSPLQDLLLPLPWKKDY
jgi:hypothetical protein